MEQETNEVINRKPKGLRDSQTGYRHKKCQVYKITFVYRAMTDGNCNARTKRKEHEDQINGQEQQSMTDLQPQKRIYVDSSQDYTN